MRPIAVMPEASAEAASIAREIIALTALPSRWIGAPPERIADDVAATLFHLCDGLVLVHVRVDLPPARGATASRPMGAPPLPGGDGRLGRTENELVLPIGQFGRHGELRVVGAPGADLMRARLLGIIAANAAEAACRSLDLERDVAQAHAKVAALAKLGALGQLVGGVAHELRTPLTYATTNLHLARRELERRHAAAAPDVVPRLDEVESALERINAIVLQLRRFAKQEVEPRIEEDVRDLVREALRLWRATHVGVADVRDRLSPTPPVLVDRGQLQQVVLNLVQNAHDAVGRNGTIVVRTADAGTHAVLTVEDDGPGMPPDVVACLFQPFHTTKPDGMGLGLSIVRGIVEAHRGTITIDSVVGKGTRVTVRIPRAAPPREPRGPDG